MANPIINFVQNEKKEMPIETEKKTTNEELKKLIEQMHESGILEIANSFLAKRKKVLEISLKELNRSEVINLINNIQTMVSIFGKIETETIENMEKGITKALQNTQNDSSKNKKLGILEFNKLLKDENINRSIRFFTSFLKEFGKTLK